MTENIDHYEIAWTKDECLIKFCDLFGEGELYQFKKADTIAIRDALSAAIEEMT